MTYLCRIICLSLLACGAAIGGEEPLPNARLPKSIRADSGKPSLQADFNHRNADGSIPVYLINAAKEVVSLDSQDGDVYLKLEVQDADGRWRRAQPHVSSWCGNSYHKAPDIKEGHFLKIPGYQPAEGKEQRVRYSLYDQPITMSSNVGMAKVSEKDVYAAAWDTLAAGKWDLDFMAKVASGQFMALRQDDAVRVQKMAVQGLRSESFDQHRVIEILCSIAVGKVERASDGDDCRVSTLALDILWHSKLDRDVCSKVLKELMQKDPDTSETAKFILECFATEIGPPLSAKPGVNPFGP